MMLRLSVWAPSRGAPSLLDRIRQLDLRLWRSPERHAGVRLWAWRCYSRWRSLLRDDFLQRSDHVLEEHGAFYRQALVDPSNIMRIEFGGRYGVEPDRL